MRYDTHAGIIALSTSPPRRDRPCRRSGHAHEVRPAQVLHPIAGRPMLLHLLAAVKALDPPEQVVVVGAGREQVEKAVAGLGVEIAVQAEQLGTGHAVRQAEAALAGFEGDVLILYGDVPLVRSRQSAAMIARLHKPEEPACVMLGFRPDDPAAYGRIMAGSDGMIARMVEHKDADARPSGR